MKRYCKISVTKTKDDVASCNCCCSCNYKTNLQGAKFRYVEDIFEIRLDTVVVKLCKDCINVLIKELESCEDLKNIKEVGEKFL